MVEEREWQTLQAELEGWRRWAYTQCVERCGGAFAADGDDDLRRVLGSELGHGVAAANSVKRLQNALKSWNVWARGLLGRDDDSIREGELRDALGNEFARALRGSGKLPVGPTPEEERRCRWAAKYFVMSNDDHCFESESDRMALIDGLARVMLAEIVLRRGEDSGGT